MSNRLVLPVLEYDQYLFEKRKDSPGPKVQVVTQSTIGWSINASMVTTGRTSGGGTPLRDTNKKIQQQLQVAFDRQMQTHTIQFNGPDAAAIGAFGGVIAEAEILWSVEGATIRRVVTVTDGMAVSGEAQSVTVNLYDQTYGSSGFAYKVAVTVAPGVRGNIQQPPLLQAPGVSVATGIEFPAAFGIGAGAVGRWNLPQNVGAVSSYLTIQGAAPPAAPLADNSILVTHRNGGGLPILSYGLNGCFKYIPLFSGTVSVEVLNNTAAAIAAAHNFGIEG